MRIRGALAGLAAIVLMAACSSQTTVPPVNVAARPSNPATPGSTAEGTIVHPSATPPPWPTFAPNETTAEFTSALLNTIADSRRASKLSALTVNQTAARAVLDTLAVKGLHAPNSRDADPYPTPPRSVAADGVSWRAVGMLLPSMLLRDSSLFLEGFVAHTPDASDAATTQVSISAVIVSTDSLYLVVLFR